MDIIMKNANYYCTCVKKVTHSRAAAAGVYNLRFNNPIL